MRSPDLDARIADALQEGLPLTERPYRTMAEALSRSEAEVLETTARLIADGTLRSFGAFVDYDRLGYEGFLCGVSSPEKRIALLPALAALLNARDEVTHNYLRSGDVGVWFTALLRGDGAQRLEADLRALDLPFILLRSRRRIKLRPSFRMQGEEADAREETIEPLQASMHLDLDDTEIHRTLSQLQTGFPVEERPYAQAAGRLNLEESELLVRLSLLKGHGILRRIGASLNHLKAGYAANALLALDYGDETADAEAGAAISRHPWLSHCYLRVPVVNTLPYEWPYGLYAMIHARSKADLQERIALLERECKPKHLLVMPTLRELKKTRYLLKG